MELVGKTLGKYHILEELGRGGMGVVYKAYDPTLERTVAIKVLAPHLVWEKEFVERFLREARAAARLSHPNIVTIYEVGEQDRQYYFVMAYLPGRSLAEIVAQRGPLPLAESLAVADQVAAALDCAHEQGLVHRDVKSSNILVDEKGRAVLTDFGIVRALGGPRLTGSGVTLGTPEYMSPEQARGDDATAASDIYALGIVLYEMLTGDVPFRATTPVAVLLKQATESPPPLRQRNPAVPPAVERVLLGALAKEPADRPATATALVAALREAACAAASPFVISELAGPAPPAPAQPLTPTPAPPAPVQPLTPTPAPPASARPFTPPPAVVPTPPPLPGVDGAILAGRPPEGPAPETAPARPLLAGATDFICAANVGRLRLAHSWPADQVEDLAWSPQGEQVGLASWNRVLLYEVRTQSSRCLEAAAPLRCLAFSPDGRIVAAGGDERLVHRWRADTGEPFPALAGPRAAISSIAFSPNGQILLAASEDGSVPLWRAAEGALLGALYGHSGRVESVSFSPFGQIIASGGQDRSVRLWRLSDGRLLGTLVGHQGPVTRVVFSPKGFLLASASEDGTVRLWRVADGVLVGTLLGHTWRVGGLAFSPDGLLLASGADDGTVRLWQVATGVTLHSLGGFSGGVRGVAFSPEGAVLAVAAGDGTVRLWGVAPP